MRDPVAAWRDAVAAALPEARLLDESEPLPRPTKHTAGSAGSVFLAVRAVGWNAAGLIGSPGGVFAEVFVPGSVRVDRDLSRLPLRMRHDADDPVGVARWARTVDTGFVVVFEVAGTAAGRDAVAAVEAGLIAPSVGFHPVRADRFDHEGCAVRVRREVSLREVSLVANPAHPSAGVEAVVRADSPAQVVEVLGLRRRARAGAILQTGVQLESRVAAEAEVFLAHVQRRRELLEEAVGVLRSKGTEVARMRRMLVGWGYDPAEVDQVLVLPVARLARPVARSGGQAVRRFYGGRVVSVT